MEHFLLSGYVVNWPLTESTDGHLCTLFELLVTMIFFDCDDFSKAASVVERLVYPQDKPPHIYGSAYIHLYHTFAPRCYVENVDYAYNTVGM